MSELASLIQQIKDFNKEREWDQFHNPKDLAIALNIETSELLELFLWKREEELDINKVKAELADVFTYALTFADKYNLNILEIVRDKLIENAVKYPVEKAKGNSHKYDEL